LTHVQVEGAILFSLISIGNLRLDSAIAWQELERHCVFFLRWEFIKENKKVRKRENTLSTEKVTKKTIKNRKFILVFSFAFFVESVFSFFFLDRFLGRKRVFLLSCFLL